MSAPRATMATFIGQQALLVCDCLCSKAWGINARPRVLMSDDEDDFAYLADHELGAAPDDPGTYEGDDAKPTDAVHNRWCFRECERSAVSDPGAKTVRARDFSVRQFNRPRD